MKFEKSGRNFFQLKWNFILFFTGAFFYICFFYIRPEKLNSTGLTLLAIAALFVASFFWRKKSEKIVNFELLIAPVVATLLFIIFFGLYFLLASSAHDAERGTGLNIYKAVSENFPDFIYLCFSISISSYLWLSVLCGELAVLTLRHLAGTKLKGL